MSWYITVWTASLSIAHRALSKVLLFFQTEVEFLDLMAIVRHKQCLHILFEGPFSYKCKSCELCLLVMATDITRRG